MRVLVGNLLTRCAPKYAPQSKRRKRGVNVTWRVEIYWIITGLLAKTVNSERVRISIDVASLSRYRQTIRTAVKTLPALVVPSV